MLYSTYRPLNFQEVVGQDNNLITLKEQVKQNKFDSASRFTIPRNQNLITDASFTLAICATASSCTRIRQLKTLLIQRRSNGSGTAYSILQRVHNLIHSRNYNHSFRSIYDSCNTITGTIHIYHLAIQANRICASDKNISTQAAHSHLVTLILGCACVTIQRFKITRENSTKQANLLGRHRSTPADTRILRDQFQRFF